MSLIEHARRELHRNGQLETGEGQAILQAVAAFSAGGWSGGGFAWGIETLRRVASYEPLSPLTNDPGEWEQVEWPGGGWQNRRDSRAISHDSGLTYWLVDDWSTRGAVYEWFVAHLSGRSRRVLLPVARRLLRPIYRAKPVVLRRGVLDGGELGTVIQCYRCDGTRVVGVLDSERRRCPECDGMGELHSLDRRPEPVEPEQPREGD